ncbi:Nuclear segregation protein [Apiospora sp. TS-2023a]
MAEVAAAPAATKVADKKPEKPDVDLFNERLTKAEKEHKAVMDKYNAIKAKVEIAVPNKNKESQSPTQKRRAELIAQLQEIRSKQGVGKNARNTKMDQLKRLDEQMRSRIAEQKTARGKVNFKSAEDLDREIERLDKQVNGGMMKLVDEKKALTEISNLRKQRKNFAQFDNSQKGIDELKAKIKELKDSMDDPEARAMSEQYTKLQTELDGIKAEQDEAFKNLNALRDERSKLHAEQQEKWTAVKQLKDEFHAAKRAHAEYEREARNRARERQRTEREKFDKEKKMERAQKMLEEASEPAYLDEIRRANSLLHFFDPSTAPAEKDPLLVNKGLAAEAARKVDDSGLKGMKVVSKKTDEEYMPAAKKGKKNKKTEKPAAEKKSGAFNCPPSVIEDCSSMGIEPPMSAAEIPEVVKQVKEKLDHWKSDQKTQTQRNVDKAKKEIERLEADEAAEKTNGVNGDKKADDKVEAVASDLKETSLEDKKE